VEKEDFDEGKADYLVVDDDLAHRTMLRTLLTGWGYGITEADDGRQRHRGRAPAAFDLILMGHPQWSESPASKPLPRFKGFNPAIPVLIMTAYASVETAVQALKQGAYDYLTSRLISTSCGLPGAGDGPLPAPAGETCC
jgi:two-component system response regulator HydG